jgi:hypothetical protein
MAGPAESRDPAIHGCDATNKGVDGRDKHGHDGSKFTNYIKQISRYDIHLIDLI